MSKQVDYLMGEAERIGSEISSAKSGFDLVGPLNKFLVVIQLLNDSGIPILVSEEFINNESERLRGFLNTL